jgi:hypothetical protein
MAAGALDLDTHALALHTRDYVERLAILDGQDEVQGKGADPSADPVGSDTQPDQSSAVGVPPNRNNPLDDERCLRLELGAWRKESPCILGGGVRTLAGDIAVQAGVELGATRNLDPEHAPLSLEGSRLSRCQRGELDDALGPRLVGIAAGIVCTERDNPQQEEQQDKAVHDRSSTR